MLVFIERNRLLLALILALLVVGSPGLADAADPPGSVAEIRIELPAGNTADISLAPGRRTIVMELPRGSIFPLDFSGSSGGLLRGGAVSIVSEDRVRLELDLAHGLLDNVEYQSDAILLRFTSRQRAGDAEADANAYRLGVGDKIQVIVHNQPEMSSMTVIGEDGTITLPILGPVDVSDATPRQLAERLTELLGRDYLVDPQVDIIVDEFRSQWVMVTGYVREPARVPLRGGTRLKEVLAEVGGFSEQAGEEITVSRTNAISGEIESISIQRIRFEAGSDDIVLHHGDIVEVHAMAYAHITGEVRNSARVFISRGLTLLQALTQVGGLSEWADRKNIMILYPEGIFPRERVVNLKKIENGQAEDPILVGGEKIIVKRRFF